MATHETKLTTTSTQTAYHVRVVKYACKENGQLYIMAFNGAVLDLCNRAVSEKNPQIF